MQISVKKINVPSDIITKTHIKSKHACKVAAYLKTPKNGEFLRINMFGTKIFLVDECFCNTPLKKVDKEKVLMEPETCQFSEIIVEFGDVLKCKFPQKTWNHGNNA